MRMTRSLMKSLDERRMMRADSGELLDNAVDHIILRRGYPWYSYL